MKKTTILLLNAICVLLFSAVHAGEYEGASAVKALACNRACFTPNWCQIADAGFNTQSPADWYTITTFPFPVTTPLSLFRNTGTIQGNFQLTPTGLTIGQPGNYAVTVTAFLTSNDSDVFPNITVFLVKNGVFDPLDTSTIEGVAIIPFEEIASIQASGILQNVPSGTELSLAASNGGSLPADVIVVGWRISVFRIPCDLLP